MRLQKVILFIIIFNCICFFPGCNANKQTTLAEIEYSENIESIKHYFSELQTIENVYFKSVPVGPNGGIGPSSFCIVGFICISDTEKNLVYESFDFIVDNPEFPEGISPTITNKTEFSWYSSKDFSNTF